MTTVGYLFLLMGVAFIRQVIVGRTKDLPDDAKDFVTALLNADPNSAGEVLSRRGSNVDDAGSSEVATDPASFTSDMPSAGEFSNAFASQMVRLGTNAKGYVLGATGPSYYDCSGLVWKALKDLGIFTGARFTTHNFERVAPQFARRLNGSPSPGDIVVWPNHHIGVVIGTDKLYSARSPSKGIGPSTISGDSAYFKSQPHYWRIVYKGGQDV